ncbi:mob-like protein phocein [Anaeramoeba flamelloides]|uniref:Mob-like protein phocein n=1 Tax=Anaeramoeba flamelloides TaxID=1746091 RepID=A0ABQ8X5T6_9EUKA|nr:mob-like protein phocein [Anaeramoeba flamelloides]
MTQKIVRRNRKGTKNKDLFKWPNETLDEMDGALRTQQYIQRMIQEDASDVWKLVRLPKSQDKYVWIYEHLRQIVIELNDFCVFHNGVWTVENHPDMRLKINGEETAFFSSAFYPPKKVPAIDYITQTIEQTQDTLNNSTLFPSRAFIPQKGQQEFQNIFRRLARIFAFSFYEYPDYFKKYEEEQHLFKRFKTLGLEFEMITQQNLLIPENVGELLQSEKTKSQENNQNENSDDSNDDEDSDSLLDDLVSDDEGEL